MVTSQQIILAYFGIIFLFGVASSISVMALAITLTFKEGLRDEPQHVATNTLKRYFKMRIWRVHRALIISLFVLITIAYGRLLFL